MYIHTGVTTIYSVKTELALIHPIASSCTTRVVYCYITDTIIEQEYYSDKDHRKPHQYVDILYPFIVQLY